MDQNQIEKLIAVLENINANIFSLKEEISSGIEVYNGGGSSLTIEHSHEGSPLQVNLCEQDQRFEVVVRQDASDGLDVRITNPGELCP